MCIIILSYVLFHDQPSFHEMQQKQKNNQQNKTEEGKKKLSRNKTESTETNVLGKLFNVRVS